MAVTEDELRAKAAKKSGNKITHGTWNKNPGNIKGFNGSGGKNSYAKWLDKKGIKYAKGTKAHDGGYFIKFENNNDGLYAKANFWNVAKSWGAYKKGGKPMTVSEAVQKYSGAQYNDDGTQKKGTGYQQSFLNNLEENGIDLSAPIDSLSSDSLILLSNFQMQTEDPNQYRTLQKEGLITEDGQFNYEGATASTEASNDGMLTSTPRTLSSSTDIEQTATEENDDPYSDKNINAGVDRFVKWANSDNPEDAILEKVPRKQEEPITLKSKSITSLIPSEGSQEENKPLTETQALLKNLKNATDESSGKRAYTVKDVDLDIVNSAEKNIRNYYIDNYSDKKLDDDDIMMGEKEFDGEESIFSRISSELSSDLDMQTEKGQAVFKARLLAYQEKVSSPEYIENLRSTYQGPSLRTPLTKDMAYTNIVQDTNFKLKLLGQTVNSANKQNDIIIEDRDFKPLGNAQHTGSNTDNLKKIPGTNQDAIVTAQIIAKRLAKEGNTVLADLLMEDGGLQKAGQLVLDETSKQSLNKDNQGSDIDYDVITSNIERRITDPEGYAEETGQTNVNQNSSDLVNTSFDVSAEDQAKLDAEAEYIKKVEEGTATQEERDAAMVGHEDRLAKALASQKEKKDTEKSAADAAAKDALKGERREKRMRTAEKVLSGLKAAAGVLSLSKAMQDPEIDIPEISPLVMEAVEKQRALAKSGLTSKEKGAAMQNMNNAYAGAMKNVLRASGGQRGMFLANQGTVDAQRIQGLNQLAAQDAALHRQNIQQYNALASSVGQMKLQRDMTAEQMKQTAIAQNKKMLGGIGSNLVSDAMSDLSWYMNPNRDLIEKAQRTSLEGMLGESGNNTYDADDGYQVGGNNTRAVQTAEQKAEKARQKQIDDLNK